MSRYHASSSSCSTENNVLSHRQKYASHMGAADKKWRIEINLANYLFAAEMYAADLLMTRQKRVTNKRSHIRISGGTLPRNRALKSVRRV